MNTLISQSDSYQQPVWSVRYYSQARNHPQIVPKSRESYSQWGERLMNARAVALQLTTAALLSLSLLPSTAAAFEPEKQPIYVNIISTGLCGTDPFGPFPPSPCPVPAGQRLIIEHVSGYAFLPTSTETPRSQYRSR